jgi:hypothetical protein
VQPSSRQHARRRRALAAALVAAAVPALSACQANFGSPVLQDYNPSTGVNVREGGVWGMNLLVVLDESGQGSLVGALVNNARRPDRLVGVTLQAEQGRGPLRTTMVRRQVTLPPDRLVKLEDPATVAVEGDVPAGAFVGLTLQFQRAQPIETKIPVVAAEGPYAEVQIPASSEATASPSPTTPESPAESPPESPAESPAG